MKGGIKMYSYYIRFYVKYMLFYELSIPQKAA